METEECRECGAPFRESDDHCEVCRSLDESLDKQLEQKEMAMPKVIDVIRVLEKKDPNEQVGWMLPVEWPYTGPAKRDEGDTAVYLNEVFSEATEHAELGGSTGYDYDPEGFEV